MGVIVNSDGLKVNVSGNVIPAKVVDPLVVAPGDPVIVDVVGESRGQSTAWVIGRATGSFRPAQGTVTTVPVGSQTITVTGDDGTAYTAGFVASYTPTVGDKVILSWNASQPTVMGRVGAAAAAGSGNAGVSAPPAPPVSGTSTYNAIDSGTLWAPGGWGSWAGGGSHVYQGSWGSSGQLVGAWFYGGAASELAGRTITRIRFTLGRRRPVGSNNSPVTVHIKSHTSANRPGGSVTFGGGTVDVTADPYQDFREYDLPLSFASDLQGGGGIGLYGDPYAGFDGVLARADSGLLIIDWTR
jgi:hypothetical protein